MTNDLKNASNAAFINYPWSGSTNSPSTTMNLTGGPAVTDVEIDPHWDNPSLPPSQNYGSVTNQLTIGGEIGGSTTTVFSEAIQINMNNLTLTVNGSFTNTINFDAGDVKINGFVSIILGRAF